MLIFNTCAKFVFAEVLARHSRGRPLLPVGEVCPCQDISLPIRKFSTEHMFSVGSNETSFRMGFLHGGNFVEGEAV